MTCYASLPSDEVPSILEQTKWDAGFFNFGKLVEGSPAKRCYNPSVVEHEGARWLIVRLSEELKDSPYGKNRLLALRLNGKHQPTTGYRINFNGAYPEQHFEDPRITKLQDGTLLLSYTTFYLEVVKQAGQTMQRWRGAHQGIATLGADFQPLHCHDPVYGVNGGSVMLNKSDEKGIALSEKNWTWFQHDGVLHTVYMTEPHEVLTWEENFSHAREIYKSAGPPEGVFNFGHPRGGTPPVRVGEEYWSFFHSSTLWDEWNRVHPGHSRRRYHMGTYAFEAKPPFRITRFSRTPILTGSQQDPWFSGLPLVVFPCGALLDASNAWFVTMGINDCASAWISIPHEELIKITPRIDETEAIQEEITATVIAPNRGHSEDSGAVEVRHGSCGLGDANPCSATSAGVAGDHERPEPNEPVKKRRQRGKPIRKRRSKPVLATVGL